MPKNIKVVGFVCSAWDLCHAGHILHLKEAKSNCDYLIAGLHVDPSRERKEKSKPVETVSERYIRLQAIKYIDEIIPYETEAELYELIKALPIDVRFLGKEYEQKDFTGRDLSDLNNHRLHFTNRLHNFSSTHLRQRLAKSKENRLP